MTKGDKQKKVDIIENMYPYVFSDDMGSYRRARRGIRETTYIRPATDEEQSIIENIIKAL